MLFSGVAVMLSTAVTAQSLELKLVPEFGGTRPLRPEVVQMSARDKGPLFGGMQGGLVVEGSYEFTPQLAFIGHLGYSTGRARFEMPCGCAHTQDRVVLLKNELEYGSAEAIGALRFRTRSEKFWYARVGFGAGTITDSKREVSYFTHFIGQRPDSTSSFISEDYPMSTRRNSKMMPLMDLGIGRRFGDHHVVDVELFVRNDLDDWVYSVTNHQHTTQQVDLRRHMIGVRCGILLGGWRPRPPAHAVVRRGMAHRS